MPLSLLLAGAGQDSGSSHGTVRGPGGSHGRQGAEWPADPGAPEHGAPAPPPEGSMPSCHHGQCPPQERQVVGLHLGQGWGPQAAREPGRWTAAGLPESWGSSHGAASGGQRVWPPALVSLATIGLPAPRCAHACQRGLPPIRNDPVFSAHCCAPSACHGAGVAAVHRACGNMDCTLPAVPAHPLCTAHEVTTWPCRSPCHGEKDTQQPWKGQRRGQGSGQASLGSGGPGAVARVPEACQGAQAGQSQGTPPQQAASSAHGGLWSLGERAQTRWVTLHACPRSRPSSPSTAVLCFSAGGCSTPSSARWLGRGASAPATSSGPAW